MTTENEKRVVTLFECPICKKVQEYGPFTCPNSNVGSHEYAQTEPVEVVPKQELTQAEERGRELAEALVVAAIIGHESERMVPEGDAEELIEAVFAKGYVRTRRDICDEYETVLTDEGQAFVGEVVKSLDSSTGSR